MLRSLHNLIVEFLKREYLEFRRLVRDRTMASLVLEWSSPKSFMRMSLALITFSVAVCLNCGLTRESVSAFVQHSDPMRSSTPDISKLSAPNTFSVIFAAL